MPIIDYPSNSMRALTPEPSSVPKVIKVTRGMVTQRKKPLLARIFSENTKSVAEYILWDVLIPAAKNTVTEMISNGIEMLVYGEPQSNKLKRSRDRSYVSYTSYYEDRKERNRSSRREHNRSRHSFDDIVLDTRADAEEVLFSLVELIDEYDVATVANLYDLIGLPEDFTDHKYGWNNLSKASVRRVREGYILDLPRPMALD